jgi:hypothetical protein
MQPIVAYGSYCPWPRETYSPHDLPPDGHLAIQRGYALAARYDGLGEDAAAEAGADMYARWLGRDYVASDVARGDHYHAYCGTLAWARKSAWRGWTGGRRRHNGKHAPRDSAGRRVRITVWKACEAYMRLQYCMRQRNLPLPHDPALALERIEASPNLRRRAARVAKRIGMSVADMVRLACGFCAE